MRQDGHLLWDLFSWTESGSGETSVEAKYMDTEFIAACRSIGNDGAGAKMKRSIAYQRQSIFGPDFCMTDHRRQALRRNFFLKFMCDLERPKVIQRSRKNALSLEEQVIFYILAPT